MTLDRSATPLQASASLTLVVLLSAVAGGIAAPALGQLLPAQAQLLLEEDGAPYGPPITGGSFAEAMATGDFNGDGFDDLAVGRPSTGSSEPGRVYVLHGGPDGLTFAQVLLEVGSVDYGAALAACDLDDDGFDDLMVGDPRGEIGGIGGGRVFTYRGNPVSLLVSQTLDQAHSGLGETVEAGDDFGAALAAADFDGDGSCDLVIGVPGEDLGAPEMPIQDAGLVHLVPGLGTGALDLGGSIALTQDSPSLEGVYSDAQDFFGARFATGQLRGTPVLMVGVPAKDVGGKRDAGMVVLYLRGGSEGAFAFDSTLFSGAVSPQPRERFGEAVTMCDFDGDDTDDVAIGSPGFELLGQRAGAAMVLLASTQYALPSGLILSQLQSVAAVPQDSDAFGSALVGGDFDGDAYCDLAVGVPNEPNGFTDGYGAVHVFHGSTLGPSGQREIYFREDDVGGALDRDRFGTALAAADFTRNGTDELVVGVPDKDDILSGLASRGFYPGEDEGAAYRVPALHRLVSAALRVRTGAEVSGSQGRRVVELSDPAADGTGRLGYRGRFEDGESFVWVDDGIVFQDSDEGGLPLAGKLLDQGFVLADGGRFAFVDTLQAPGPTVEVLYTSGGELVRSTDVVDGMLVGPPRNLLRTATGRIQFINSGVEPDFAGRSAPLVQSPVEISRRFGDAVGSEFVETIAELDISALGTHSIWSGSVGVVGSSPAVVVDEVVVAREGDFLADFIVPVDSFHEVAINEAGDFLFIGRVGELGVLFGGSGSVVTDALTPREVAGALHVPTALAVAENGARLHLWSWSAGEKARLLWSCSEVIDPSSRILLRSGQELDFDGDGVGDATVVDIPAPITSQVLEPTAKGEVHLRVELESGAESYEAIVTVPADCGFFRDGFESGDLSGWSGAVG